MTTDDANSIGATPSPRRLPLGPLILPAVVLVVVALFNWYRLESTPYSSDQINIATMLLKYRHPELFPAEQGLR